VILVDSSVWVDHLRVGRRALQHLLERGAVLGHPWVTGELALGHLAQRRAILGLLGALPSATVATSEEALVFIDRHGLAGTGVGYVDVQLLAAAQLTPDTRFWTTDKRLAATAARLGLAVDPVALNDGP
jgi:predicted nucleic acid-binding protein